VRHALTRSVLPRYDSAQSNGPPFLESTVLPTSPSAPAGHQLRLYVPRETVARLVDLQARALAAGFRKPTYSDLIQAAVSKVDTSDLADLLENVGS
jgi:hypothetical protein